MQIEKKQDCAAGAIRIAAAAQCLAMGERVHRAAVSSAQALRFLSRVFPSNPW